MRWVREERAELTGELEGVRKGPESAELEMAVRRIHATRVLVQGGLRERNPVRGNGLSVKHVFYFFILFYFYPGRDKSPRKLCTGRQVYLAHSY